MENYLTPKLDNQELLNISTLGLAHIGDSVFEIMARSFLATKGVATSKNLHKETVMLVNANSQAKYAKFIEPLLLENELAVFKRGRNSKPKTVPKSSSREDYGLATALEAVFGYLYLRQEYDRINQLFDKIIKNEGEENV